MKKFIQFRFLIFDFRFKNKKNKSTILNLQSYIYLTIAVLSTLIITSCAHAPIEVKKITGYNEIKEGDEATIEWDFKNADKVKIEGFWGVFEPTDKFFVKPKKSRTYRIIAYRENGDSLVVNTIVNIKQEAPKEVKTGPTSIEYSNLKASTNISDYLEGFLQTDGTIKPTSLKVMRTIYPYSTGNFLVRALLMDENGNFLQGCSLDQSANWIATLNCDGLNNNLNIGNFTERDNSLSSNIDVGILLDNSSAAKNNEDVLAQIKKFIPFLTQKDNIMLSVFNHSLIPVFKLSSPDKSFVEMQGFLLPPADGLNALYKSAYQSISDLNKGLNKTKILVIITFNADNSSIIYTSTDVAKIAHDSDVPVYIIGIGNAIEGYFLKYLSSLTGGRFYYLNIEDINKISDVLTEMAFSQKFYYEFLVSVPNEFVKCNTVKSNLEYKSDKSDLNDFINIIPKPEIQYSRYQALATFNYRDINISPDYDETITSLAKVLTDNPASIVELIGNSSIEGNSIINLDISLKRAQEVRKMLIAKGVNPAQLRVRADGPNKPIYYLQNSPWQQQYNRRVEVRWLDPTILPYEIIADKAWTEEDALKKVEEWEARRFKSYYERYLQDNIPTYRVKLWGYATLDEAENTVKLLDKKYRDGFVVE
ncbi:MAG: OmpA family protein [FCB group bacterium]